MSTNATARIIITAVSSLCAGLWGYAVPTYLAASWRWRLLALPAAVIAGVVVWLRYGSRPVVDPLVQADVSTPARVAVTAGAVLPVSAGASSSPSSSHASLPAGRWRRRWP